MQERLAACVAGVWTRFAAARRNALFVLAAACALLAVPAQASMLWFGDQAGIHQIDTAANQVVANVVQDQSSAMVVNPKDGSLWVLTASRLLKYSATGSLLSQTDLKSVSNGQGSIRRLALGSSDDSVWVAVDKVVAHFTSDAAQLASFQTPELVQDIAIAQDQSLWVLGQTQLLHYSAAGALPSVRLDALTQNSQYLALDDAANVMWLAGGAGFKHLEQLDSRDPSHVLQSLTLGDTAAGLAVAPDTHTLWVLGPTTLTPYAISGAAGTPTSLKSLNNTQAIAYDQSSQSLWVGHGAGISRFTAQGLYVTTLAAKSAANVISTSPSGIVPLLTLLQPTNGGLLANATPTIRFQYGAQCFGQPCGYPPSAFAAYHLDATLNGGAIGSQFVFDGSNAQASYTPTSRLPEGINNLSAKLVDDQGRTSLPLQASFTIDTTPPRFVSVAPASGSTFNSPQITVQGSVDDPQAVVLFSASSATQPQNFSFAATLHAGTNSFTLSAVDTAGNQSSMPLSYAYAPPNAPPSVSLTSPAAGASFTALATVPLTATASDSDGSVAKVEFFQGSTLIGTATSAPYTATWANVPAGSYTLTARATDNLGATTTSVGVAITVKPTPLTITSPANGATVNGDSVLVKGTFAGPANTGVVVNRNIALTDVNNNFYVTVPLVAGANTLTASMSTPDGQTASQSVTVNSDGIAPAVKISANTTGGLAPLTVGFTVVNGSANSVNVAFNGSFVEMVPAGATGGLSITYTQPFSYPVTITATDTQGKVTSKSFVFVVTSLAQTDQMLKSIWSQITSKLAAGNIEGALAYFAPGARDRYRKVLNDIAPGLPAMFASFPPITPTKMTVGDAEYFVVLPQGGVNYGYYLYFTQGPDGVWRLETL
jgi:hypothetical protein